MCEKRQKTMLKKPIWGLWNIQLWLKNQMTCADTRWRQRDFIPHSPFLQHESFFNKGE